MARFDTSDVRRYYDRHTRAFLRYGQGGGVGVIHRAVWGPGVIAREQAFHYVDDLIADRARSLAATSSTPLHLVDLGCGVGATLCYLVERLPAIRGTGVTLSPLQARIAAERIRASGFTDRVACIEADYTNLPAGLAAADLAYAIEAFAHGPSPERFFAERRQLVRPGGLLVIVDDFRRSNASAEAARTIERFCRGWRINTLLDADELRAVARQAGFAHESTTGLTSMLEIRRARDRAIDVLAAVLEWLRMDGGRFGYLAGGSALQQCLARGWIGYDLTVFRRART
jgi:SAM-dependent methyltransferase